ncbi:Clc-like protein [Dirofilaria immitis]
MMCICLFTYMHVQCCSLHNSFVVLDNNSIHPTINPSIVSLRRLRNRDKELSKEIIVEFRNMGNAGHKAQKAVLICSLILLLIALGISVVAVLSPSWQVVDIREFRAQHHHGLWQDCTRPHYHSYGISSEEYREMQHTPLSCTYKFDRNAREIIDENLLNMNENSAAAEAEYHQFFGWQKAVLICFVVVFAINGLALLFGICAPCSNHIAVFFTILIFIALFFSIVANATFFFAAHRVDSRFVHGLVGTYEQEIGSAFYLSLTSTSLLLFSFLLALVSTYYLIQDANKPDRFISPVMRELVPLYNATRHTAI